MITLNTKFDFQKIKSLDSEGSLKLPNKKQKEKRKNKMVYLNKILKISDAKPPGTKEEILEVFFPVHAKLRVFSEKNGKIVVYCGGENLKKTALCIAAAYKRAKQCLPRKIVVIGKEKKVKVCPSEFYDFPDMWLWIAARVEKEKRKKLQI